MKRSLSVVILWALSSHAQQLISPPCPLGSEQIGDIDEGISGNGLESLTDLNSTGQCMDRCVNNPKCKSFTWRSVYIPPFLHLDPGHVCSLYDSDVPNDIVDTSVSHDSQIMCKPSCGVGYFWQDGDVPGYGEVGGVGSGRHVSNCQECADLCSAANECHSYECSATELKCNLNAAANPTPGASQYKDYAFCTGLDSDALIFRSETYDTTIYCDNVAAWCTSIIPYTDRLKHVPENLNCHGATSTVQCQGITCPFNHDCDCHWEWCRRNDCTIKWIDYDASKCDIPLIENQNRQEDIGAQVGSLIFDTAANLISELPIAGSAVSNAMSLGKGIFDIDGGGPDELVNNLIDDINSRITQLEGCMGEKIDELDVQIHIDAMEGAWNDYQTAASFVGDDMWMKKVELHGAWLSHLDLVISQLDDDDKSAKYFKGLLLPLQDFAGTFLLASIDYLIILTATKDPNYEHRFGETVRAFDMIRVWTTAAWEELMHDMSVRMRGIWTADRKSTCDNVEFIRDEMTDWSEIFYASNIKPIMRYMDKLYELDNVLSGEAACAHDQYYEAGRCG